MAPVFENIGERCTAENYHPISLRSVVSKVFEKLVNNRIGDHLEKFGLFSDFQYGFRSSRLTEDFLAVVSDRIAKAFNRSGATRAVALDISKAFDRVWHAGLLHKLKSNAISSQIFGIISSFVNNRRLRVVLDGKSPQEYPVNAGGPQGSILGPTLFLLYINDLPDDVICDIAIYTDDTTLILLLRLLCISINLTYAHIWDTVVTSGFVPLVATWNCWTSYKIEYAGLLVLHLLLLLNPWLIVKMWPA